MDFIFPDAVYVLHLRPGVALLKGPVVSGVHRLKDLIMMIELNAEPDAHMGMELEDALALTSVGFSLTFRPCTCQKPSPGR